MPETLIKEITNTKQNENLRYIDDKEIQSLKELLQKNLIENQDTKEKLVKETKNAIKKHIGPLSAGIKNFVNNSNRIDSILKQEGGEKILKQYENVLLILQNIMKDPNEKWDDSRETRDTKKRIADTLIRVQSRLTKITTQVEQQKQFEKGFASIQVIFGDILNKHPIINNPKILPTVLEDFCTLHNAHSNHKLSIENLGTEIFKLNNLQKEQFATHLATILSGDMKGGKDKSIALRQQIFGKLYTTNQTPPLLKDWKPLMHGDGSGTASNISGEKWDYDSRKKRTGTTAKERGGYDYSEDPRTKDILPYSNYEVTRPSFLNKLSIVFNIRGVNDVGAKITLTLPDPNKANQFITITGQTKGYPEKNGVLANSIDFNIPPEAKGISLENGSLVFDSKLFPKKPTIKIKTESLGTGKKGQASEYDEVIVDVFSDGSFDSNIAHADDGQQSYEKGEYLSERFEKELPLLTNLLKTRIPDGYKLPIALRATTDYTRVTPNLLAKLNTDLPELQKNLQAQLGQNRYKKIIDQVAPQRENFDGDEDNYKLAQCRVYEMLLKITEELTKAGLLHKIDINHISLTKEKETRESSFHLGELAKEKTGQ